MLRKPQVADDARMKEADRVACRGIPESGMEFLGDCGATQDRATLEHRYREACLGEVTRAHEPVVTAADDDGVEASDDRCHCVIPGERARPRGLASGPKG